MNAQERIVEAYYRLVKNCLTVTDVKIEFGNNRQFDILAYQPRIRKYYHIEVDVTHCENWCKTLNEIEDGFAYKFFGIPKDKRPDNPNTDAAKGKNYLKQIKKTYEGYGINFNDVTRVWCSWSFKEGEEEKEKLKNKLAKKYDLTAENFELLSFRDEVLHKLNTRIGTSNYDDEIVRTLSLVSQYQQQKRM